jgi:hypothetical protein
MATTRLITADDIISNFYNLAGIDEVNWDYYNPMFKRWVEQAITKIGVGDQQIGYTTAIPITSLVFPIPNNLATLIDCVLTNGEGDKIRPQWSDDMNFYAFNPDADNRSVVYMQQVGSNYVLSSNADNYTLAHLRFYGIPTATTIDQYYEEAVTDYLMFRWKMNKRSTNPKEIPMSEVQYHEMLWLKKLGDAASYRKRSSRPKMDAAMKVKTSMLPYYRRMYEGYRGGSGGSGGSGNLGGIFDFTFDETFN